MDIDFVDQTGLHFKTLGAGRPLLFLHGFGASLYTWRHVVPALAHNHKLYLVDLKGFGKSPKPLDHAYSVRDQAELVANFIQRHKLRNLTVIGHSFGGGVALLVALSSEVSGLDRLSSLILIDTISYPQTLPTFMSVLRTPILGRAAVSLVPPELQVRSILRQSYYDKSKISEETVSEYASAIKQPGGRHALVETAKQIMPTDLARLTSQYSKLHHPTLVLWGRNDVLVPLRNGIALAQTIPNAELRIIEESGHMPQEEKPEKVIGNIRCFLKNIE